MASARKKQRQPPLTPGERSSQLNDSSLPASKREWQVYRRGVLEGIERAHAEAHERADAFLLRALCGGIELDSPSAADAERSRVKTPAEFTPQLKKRGSV